MRIFECFKYLIMATLTHQCLTEHCNIRPVDKKRYTIQLWGREIIRSCKDGELFDTNSCQCTDEFTFPNASNIVGGMKVPISQVPFSLSLSLACFDPGPTSLKVPFFCSAVLIRKRWAITANHCVTDDLAAKTCKDITSGSTYEKPWTYLLKAASSISDIQSQTDLVAEVLHIYRKPSSDIDMVLLRLDKTFEKVRGLKPIQLANPKFELSNRVCLQIGYGHQTDKIRDEYLRWTTTYLLSECPRKAFLADFVMKHWMTCVWDIYNGANICSGDSGGGLLCHNPQQGYAVVGVASLASAKCERKHIGVYAATAQWYDGINKIIQHADGINSCVNCKKLPRTTIPG